MHGNKVYRAVSLSRDGDALMGTTLSGVTLFRIERFSTTVRDLKEQVAEALKTNDVDDKEKKEQAHAIYLSVLENSQDLSDNDQVSDVSVDRAGPAKCEINLKTAGHMLRRSSTDA